MKYLLVLAVVLVAAYIWKQNRRRDEAPPRPVKRQKSLAPTVMVACLQCGTHLPEAEAVRGQRGAYCSHEHRLLSEDGQR